LIQEGVAFNPGARETRSAQGGHVQAIEIIYDERRSLAAVLHGMLHLVRDIRLSEKQPQFDVLRDGRSAQTDLHTLGVALVLKARGKVSSSNGTR